MEALTKTHEAEITEALHRHQNELATISKRHAEELERTKQYTETLGKLSQELREAEEESISMENACAAAEKESDKRKEMVLGMTSLITESLNKCAKTQEELDKMKTLLGACIWNATKHTYLLRGPENRSTPLPYLQMYYVGDPTGCWVEKDGVKYCWWDICWSPLAPVCDGDRFKVTDKKFLQIDTLKPVE